jgi:hypothetical protein
MTNLTNQDNKNNFYFGLRTNNFAFDSAQIALTWQTLVDWINNSFGETCAAGNSQDLLSLILPHPNETLARPAIANTGLFNGKFRFTYNRIATVNTNIIVGTGQPGNSIPAPTGISLQDPNDVYYCVLNNFSLNIFSSNFSGNSLSGQSKFVSLGFVKNPLYLGNAFPRNAYFYGCRFGAAPETPVGRRPDLENTNASKELSGSNAIVNYPVSCQIATPGANTTEFYLRDSAAPNKAIGYMPNVLKTSLDIPIGQIYRNSGIDPDNSDNPYWMSVARIGDEYLLMRTWAQGLV